ncbi:MAG: ribosome maturation factor RimP [Clostridia bacterium]|nr:ribosome maturation factor RimP [Clostridia bacterium]
MQAKDLIRRVSELVLPLCENAGVTLWDVEFEKEGAQYMLTVTIDRPEGVDIDHCETVSRALDPLLDAKEFDSLPAYTLCVSSAGLARKLKKPAHFEAFLGSAVELHFYKPWNGVKQAEGTLVAYDAGRVTIDFGDRQVIFEPGDLADVRLAVQF